jgi:hypothetical protein
MGVSVYLGGGIAAVGVILFVATHPLLHRNTRLLEAWDYTQIEAALRDAPPRSRIRILETWLPHVETLAPKLIDKDKDFSLQVLLMSPGLSMDAPDLLASRVEHRNDFNRPEARRNIMETINVLRKRQKKVEEESDRVVDLQVRTYTFLPFGPFYDIGGRMFAGLYPAHTASEDGPMFIVDRSTQDSVSSDSKGFWSLLDNHFQAGWKDAKSIVDSDLVTDPPIVG